MNDLKQQSVLASLIVNFADHIDELGRLNESYFDGSNKQIFAAILDCFANNITPTPISVQSKLPTIDLQPVIACLDEQNTTKHVESILSDKKMLRLQAYSKRIGKLSASSTVPANELINQAHRELLEIDESGSVDRHTHTNTKAIDEYKKTYAQESTDRELFERETLSWGTEQLDNRLGRMKKGDVFVLAGWTKHGKSWQALDTFQHVCEQGHRSLILSTELNSTAVTERLLAMSGHDSNKLQNKETPYNLIRPALDKLASYNYTMLTGRITLERVAVELKRGELQGNPYRFIVLDHLGLLKPNKGTKSFGRTEFLEEACSEIKVISEEFNCTTLMVSQLSRPPKLQDAHPNYLRPPIATDLKGASGIEQIATSVIFVYREMNEDTGEYKGNDAILGFPFHRNMIKPERFDCKFVGYRFIPRYIHETRQYSNDTGTRKLQEEFGLSYD